ncbi:MAG: Fe-S cluster domain-containing protein [Porphyromonadaceae bacterium]|nr:Fe-S cluster domain-containing protein [Porphyromonadaceae bacterium]
MSIVWISTLSLGVIGAISAIILYLVAQKFKVNEDPRNGQIVAVLPGANCGGCGYPGCGGFAAACVKAKSLDGMLCPVGGAPVMAKIADILGMAPAEVTPKVAVVRCNGTYANRKRTSHYDGAASCAIEASLYCGETGCPYGCLGYGDCESACQFGAIRISRETGLPEVNEDLCTACGACVKACPKGLIELRNKGPKSHRMFVCCVNKDKGAVARKACTAACIGCGKCAKECAFEAITVVNNVAYIDFQKCRLCRKCEAVCPTGAIHSVNFPPRKPVEAAPAETKPVETQA